MSKEVSQTQITNDPTQHGIKGALFCILGGAFLVRMGYGLGLNQSEKILKRHDKDVRRMYKREKQIFKEQRKKEEAEKRRAEGQTGLLRFFRRRI